MSKICPLTIRLPQASPIVGAPPAEVEGASCIGSQCAWFIPITGDNGQIVDGSCAAALIPRAIGMLQRTLAERTQPLPSGFTS